MRAHARTADDTSAGGLVPAGTSQAGTSQDRTGRAVLSRGPLVATLTPAEVVRVQRLVGNRATQELVQRAPTPDTRNPNPRTPPEPPDYDRDRTVMPPVPAGLTLARITELLNEAKRTGKLTAWSVRGMPARSRAEIFLHAAIYALAKPAQWGTESDLVMPVDWPASPGAAAPRARVTVTFDRRGSATAELIATGPVPAVPQTTYAAGVARLTGSGIGFASVSGWSGTGPRDAGEISTLLAALDLLRTRAPQGLTALAGVELIRVPSLPNNRAGEFFAGSNTVLGQPADIKPYLKVTDRAFGVDEVQFAGGGGAPAAPTVPASFQLILHEVGHALESEQLRAARSTLVTAHAEAEAASRAMNVDPAVFEAERKAAERKGRKALAAFYKKQEAEYKAREAASTAAATRKQDASAAVNATLDPTTRNTKRLQKFVTLVETNRIRRFTTYAAQNWPAHPDEFYAEAYSLWLADPTFLRTNYRIVYDFFEGGDYLR